MKKIIFTNLFLFIYLLGFSQISTLNRPNDPVIMRGAELSNYTTLLPSKLVGFKYEAGVWQQIPIQIDERILLDIVAPYGALIAGSGFPASTSNPKLLFYCDTLTNVGADSDSTFDANDELVFMAKDAGGIFNGNTYPTGIVAGSCTQLLVTDPLGGSGYVYLFVNDGSLQQGADVNYVNYSSNVTTVAGFPAHTNGTNNENTLVSTKKYSWHFSAEWISDALKIKLGSDTDILDRHKNFFADGYCGRSENTFSAAENAYIVNKKGPVRVLRSYMGANSGPLTQRTHWFYEGRQDIVTNLRVHNIPSVCDAFDYSSGANGMLYRNNLNTAGVVINGVQDTVVKGKVTWEQLTGVQGTLSVLQRQVNNFGTGEITFSSYYDDNKTTPASACTGDGQAWGASGLGVIFSGSLCTDPINSSCGATSADFRSMEANRVMYADSANVPLNIAAHYDTLFNNPLQITAAACAELPNGLKEIESFSPTVFPNPSNGNFTVNLSADAKIIVTNVLGNVVLEIMMEKGKHSFHLAEISGTYFATFITKDNGKKVIRLVVH